MTGSTRSQDGSPENPGEKPPLGEDGMTYEVQIAYHEAAHALVALEVGRIVEAVSIIPAEHYGGIALYTAKSQTPLSEREVKRAGEAATPMELPARFRRRLETSAMILIAGIAADELVYLREERSSSYVRSEFDPDTEPISERSAERLTELLAAADSPTKSDTEKAWDLVSILSPRATAEAFQWLKAETIALLRSWRLGKAFDVVVPVLLERKRMPGSAFKRTLTEGGITW